ncbi:myb family transcription factor PHL8-like isoform X1 [Tripterygium wilfordii]|uniref:myb family transcription factor PHL8-like isoform X1 n=1 Tax=Tripterygium wilfordii TaxID=458696 RepID=UPI0018F7FE3E|nr:myb family transcription factor PHL8-like isoform X1 [Tripterygium wilfordii]
MQTQKMNLVMSTDAKPRLKWTPELHQKFVEAVNQLGGADKATPKGLMRVMGIHGLTLYHLKSHLQKDRLVKSQPSETSINTNHEDFRDIQNIDTHLRGNVDDGTQSQINESLQIAQVLQLQMGVQRKLHERIEVQRRLQLRIEAQGKYLQSVLKKAREMLFGYGSSTISLGLVKAELSHLVSVVNSRCPSPSVSELTETGGSMPKQVERKQMRGTVCSVESSLTSSESSGRKEEKQPKNDSGETLKPTMTSTEHPLMDIYQNHNHPIHGMVLD